MPEASREHGSEPQKKRSPTAERALAEAEQRRATMGEQASAGPKEIGGRGGKEPVRYGDWEVKGIACDF